jgi:transglutaminase-like putative cysteine protease
MKCNQLAIILFFTVFFFNANAQNFELGKVSIAELEEKEHTKDPSASAAILFKKGKMSIEYNKSEGFVMVTEVKTRIKIYKKEGYDWANQKVRYYLGNNSKENVSFTDAVTYNLADGKIEKTKLKSDGTFDEIINRYWGQKKITMPNVKEGSVIEFQYTIRSLSVGRPREYNFQTSIPVNYSEYRTFIPQYFIYNANQKGFVFPKVTVEKKPKTIKFLEMENKQAGISSSNVNAAFYESTLEYEETRTTYLAENLPAIKEEAFVNNIDNYTSSLVQELSMTQYPNQPLKPYSTDWKSVVKTIYQYDDFGPELDKTGYFEDDINTLIKGLNTQEEKVAAIFNYVKSSVKWNDYYGYDCNDGVKKAYKDKTGNVAEINLMLTAMLRYAGISANPVLLSTRSNGVALFPNRTAFDYVIAAVETQDGLVLLDATEKYSLPNVLPLRDLNWFGRLIRKDGTSIEVDLTPKTLSKEIVNTSVAVNSNGTITGKIRKQLTDHEALYFRQKNIITSKDNYLEDLENKNNSIEISDYVRENDLNLTKPIVETYTFKDTKDFESINGKIYISPLLFLSTKVNPFKQEVREYPIDFGYPIENKYNIMIEIPEGYVVETLPASMNIATGDNIGTFKYVIGATGNKIQISITSDINTAIVSADYYPMLKEFFQKMIDKQNEKIVLKKV